MHESIESKLAINIAQLALDKATIEAQLEHCQNENDALQKQVSELQNLLELQTAPGGAK